MRSTGIALSAAAVVVTVVSTVVVVGIAPDGSTEQGAAFAVTGISTLAGIATGVIAGLVAGAGARGAGFGWAAANIFVGLPCVALALSALIANM
jgi:hypothetical protein